jgi:ParB family chromosome partitioning protein
MKYARVCLNAIQLPAMAIRSRNFDPARLQELAASMALIGQLQPIGAAETGQSLHLVFGSRRLKAAQMLGWQKIDACVLDLSGAAQALIINLAENWHHEPLRTLQNIQAIQHLAEAGFAGEHMARMIACPPDWIADHLAIARDPVARSMAQAGLLLDARNLKNFEALPKRIRKLLIETL